MHLENESKLGIALTQEDKAIRRYMEPDRGEEGGCREYRDDKVPWCSTKRALVLCLIRLISDCSLRR